MKLLAPALIFCGAAFGQSPQVPHKMQFAGMTLTIRDDARRDIQKDVDALTLHPRYFLVKAERARTYFPIIEKIFAEERLPDDFKFLALQESALVADAVSSSNAVGFWQFKDFTAREMGLRVDEEVDERMNIVSASRAAARYIKQCNHYFNNWIFALQSYQMGAGGVMRAVGEGDLGTRHMEITPDTYWYVRKYLAHKVAFEGAVGVKPALQVSKVDGGGRTLAEIAKEVSLDEQKLREFNKWLKAERVPADREYAVILPTGDAIAGFGTLSVPSAKPTPVVAIAQPEEAETPINGIPTIRARAGESIRAIAERGGVSLSDFLHYNELTSDQTIRAGQIYFVERKKKKAEAETYTTRAGDNLWTVAHRFGIQQKSLRKYNGLGETDQLSPGTVVYLAGRKPGHIESPSTTAVATLDADNSFRWDGSDTETPVTLITPDADNGSKTVVLDTGLHEVKPSDTLYSVARQYGVTIRELMDWNGKKEFALTVGEKLKVRPH
jgi:membrane-bound lytic murein transglycosylase D